MRKKIIIVMVFALLTTFSGYALSPLKVGIKAGITSQSAKLNKTDLEDYKLSTQSRIGGQVGVFARLNLLLFHVQPEMLFSMNRYQLTSTSREDLSTTTSTVKQNSLDVPVLLGFKFLMFRVNAGPVFNIMSEGSTGNKDNIIKHDVNFTKSTVSYALGLGLDLDNVGIDVRYNGQFKKSPQSIQISDIANMADFDSSYGNWAFTVAYSF